MQVNGEAIRSARVEKGWGKSRLARKSGIDRGTVFRAEAGHCNEESLAKIANALGLQITDLCPLGGREESEMLRIPQERQAMRRRINAMLNDVAESVEAGILSQLAKIVEQGEKQEGASGLPKASSGTNG